MIAHGLRIEPIATRTDKELDQVAAMMMRTLLDQFRHGEKTDPKRFKVMAIHVVLGENVHEVAALPETSDDADWWRR